jgi:hypothetical protein
LPAAWAGRTTTPASVNRNSVRPPGRRHERPWALSVASEAAAGKAVNWIDEGEAGRQGTGAPRPGRGPVACGIDGGARTGSPGGEDSDRERTMFVEARELLCQPA